MYIDDTAERRQSATNLIKGAHAVGPANNLSKATYPEIDIELDAGDMRKRAGENRRAMWADIAAKLQGTKFALPTKNRSAVAAGAIAAIHKRAVPPAPQRPTEYDPTVYAIRKAHATQGMPAIQALAKGLPPVSSNGTWDDATAATGATNNWRDAPIPNQRAMLFAPTRTQSPLDAPAEDPRAKDPSYSGLAACLEAIRTTHAGGGRSGFPY